MIYNIYHIKSKTRRLFVTKRDTIEEAISYVSENEKRFRGRLVIIGKRQIINPYKEHKARILKTEGMKNGTIKEVI